VENAHITADKISKLKGYKLKFDKPFFNEFVVECPGDAKKVKQALLKKGMLAGVTFAGSPNDLLICVTETKSEKDIDAFVSALGDVK